MRFVFAVIACAALATEAQQPVTLEQMLSAPYALGLTASPVGAEFAWVENAEGVRNIWVGGPTEKARQLTHYSADDGQDLASLTWSPDGTMLAFVRGAENGASGRPANPAHLQMPTPVQIFVQPLAAGAEARLVGEGHAPIFSRDGQSLIFVRAGQVWGAHVPAAKPVAGATTAQGGTLLDGVMGLVGSVPVPDTAKQMVFDRGAASGLTLSPDGKLLAYVSHRRSSGRGHSFIALYDFGSKELKFISPSTGNDSAPIFSPDGKQLAWLRFPFTDAPEFATNRASANPWSIELADVATGATRTLFTPEANKPGSAEPRMSTGEPHLFYPAGDKLLFFSEADGWVHLYALDPRSSRAPQLLTPGAFEVEDVALNAQGTAAVFASNATGQRSDASDIDRRHVWKLDLSTGAVSGLAAKPSGIETHPQFAADGTVAALVSSDVEPMFAGWFAKPGVEPFHEANFPSGYPVDRFVRPQQVLFKATDGLQIHGQLFLPKSPSGGKKPAIVFVHGGPKRQMLLGYPAMDYYSNAYAMNQYLALHGYIVLSVNYRCGIGYGLNFRQCEHSGADGATEYNDVLGAAAFLRARDDVDTARIGIWGGSYGGYLTALALARSSDIFAAGVDFHGVHEWSLEDNASADWLRGPLAEQEQIAAKAHASSPMADVAKWRSPVLLIHGDDDPEVAYAQTPMLADALRARRVHVEELIFPDEVHGFLLHKDWLAAYEAAAEFFDRTLKGHRVPVK